LRNFLDFSPIITTASLKHTEFLKSIGATHVIDRSTSASNLESEISGITQNMPIKYAVVPSPHRTRNKLPMTSLKKAVNLLFSSTSSSKDDEREEIFSVVGFLRDPDNIELLESLLHDNLERLLKEGAIKVSRTRKCSSVYLSLIENNST